MSALIFAVVQYGTVTQVIEADENPFPPEFNCFDASTSPSIAVGWLHNADGSFSAPLPVVVPPPSKDDLAAYAASARYGKETGGILVGTANIDTSRESQSMVANAYQFMTVSGASSTKFKSVSGWVTISADQMKSIALAVGAHVLACFAAESDIDAKITAGTITTTVQIDAAFAA